jgi:hypothetical protein
LCKSSLQGAYCLAAQINRHADPMDALRRYDQKILPIAMAYQKSARLMRSLILTRSPFKTLASRQRAPIRIDTAVEQASTGFLRQRGRTRRTKVLKALHAQFYYLKDIRTPQTTKNSNATMLVLTRLVEYQPVTSCDEIAIARENKPINEKRVIANSNHPSTAVIQR